MFSRIHLPRSTGEVRVGYDVTIRMPPWVSTPPRSFPGKRHPPKIAAVDAGDSVVAGQAFIHERVIGVDQLQNAAVFADDVLEKQRAFAFEGIAQRVVELRILHRIRMPLRDVPQMQPLSGEVVEQRLGFGVA